MSIDIKNLVDFYNSPLGKESSYSINKDLDKIWTKIDNERILGLGYPIPYISNYLDKAERVLVLMPSFQGIYKWPTDKLSLTVLIDEKRIPLPDQSIDKILVVHMIEHLNSLKEFLRETWRILVPQGKVIIIVPNKTSLWAQLDNNPFGQGSYFYSLKQLKKILIDSFFIPKVEKYSLCHLPIPIHYVINKSIFPSRKISELFFYKISGIIIIEVMKQTYSNIFIEDKPMTNKELIKITSS